MTREEALYKSLHMDVDDFYGDGHKNLINEIYNDFESRTCKNCEHYLIISGFCNNIDNEQITVDFMHMMQAYKTFGCNRFERKEVK